MTTIQLLFAKVKLDLSFFIYILVLNKRWNYGSESLYQCINL